MYNTELDPKFWKPSISLFPESSSQTSKNNITWELVSNAETQATNPDLLI